MRRGKAYKTSCEVEFGITSLSREKASPEKVLAVRRKHCLIEQACIIGGMSLSMKMRPA